MDVRLASLYNSYNKKVRPLICEIEGREEQFEEPVLLDIANMFDELSLYRKCETERTGDAMSHYAQAEANMNLCLSHSYQYLIKSLHENIVAFKKRCGKQDREVLDHGSFCSKFNSLEKETLECIRNGRNKDDLAAIADYRKAYNDLSQMEKMTVRELPVQIMRHTRRSSAATTIVQWLLSIGVSVGVGVLVNNYQTEILAWIDSMKTAF